MEALETEKMARKIIKSRRDQGEGWGKIRLTNMMIFKELTGHNITEGRWVEIVNDEETLEEESKRYCIITERKTCAEPNIRMPNARIHDDREDSAWMAYADTLRDEKHFKPEAIANIKEAAFSILRRLDNNTKGNVVKGLVFGSVQSGKTANMAALMAMAADEGFNVFIVLSGMIDNLRQQTMERLVNDLSGQSVVWHPFVPGSKLHTDPQMFIHKRVKYLTVCLKHPKNLKKLLKNLNEVPLKYSQMKILIIDDEADQASIGTHDIKESDRKGINSLIVNMVNERDGKGAKIAGHYGAMNYVSYTATPYANLLNEASRESLYPGNFILALTPSKEYFGPQQIFGTRTYKTDVEYPGLQIVNTSKDIDKKIRLLEKGETKEMPEELFDCLCWFICSVSALRLRNYDKPISMLVNTSGSQDSHANVGKFLADFIEGNRSQIIERCRPVYEKQKNQLTKSDLRERYPDYSGSFEKIYDYPEFDEILPGIKYLLDRKCEHIAWEDNSPVYYHWIHICIEDSSKNTCVDSETPVNPRLIYPSDKDSMPDPAPAFLAVGGNTLSRGLTIQGLVSTCFLRPIQQADTLMQMGRWFGYRPKYELFPRIWMSEGSKKDFEFLAELDVEISEEIESCKRNGVGPRDCGIRLLAVPGANILRRLTSNSKQQSKIQAQIDYADRYKEFCKFENDEAKLYKNMEITKNFLSELETITGCPAEYDEEWNVYRWKNVSFHTIYEKFLKDFTEGIDNHREIELFKDWVLNTNKKTLDDWRVLLVGSRSENEFVVNKKIKIGKTERSKEKLDNDPDNSLISIKTLRDRADLNKMVFPNELPVHWLERIKSGEKLKKDERQEMLRDVGLEKTPLMVIYCIDKNSRPHGKTENVPLNAKEDVIAFLVDIPDVRLDGVNETMVKIDLGGISDDEDVS